MTRRVVALVAVALTLVGCVGATRRSAFEEEVRARGGGISGAEIERIVRAVADEVAVTDPVDLEILSMRIDARSRGVTVMARRGDQPDFVDVITLREAEVRSATPRQDADPAEVERDAFAVVDVRLGDAETLVDQAIEAFDDPDALVSTFSVGRSGDGPPMIEIELESSRRTGEFQFDADGRLVAGATS